MVGLNSCLIFCYSNMFIKKIKMMKTKILKLNFLKLNVHDEFFLNGHMLMNHIKNELNKI